MSQHRPGVQVDERLVDAVQPATVQHVVEAHANLDRRSSLRACSAHCSPIGNPAVVLSPSARATGGDSSEKSLTLGARMVDLKFVASPQGATVVSFEPIGTPFNLGPNDVIYLRISEEEATQLEFVIWPTGVAVWLAHYPEVDYWVLDENKTPIELL
jgi:hypothetical protein